MKERKQKRLCEDYRVVFCAVTELDLPEKYDFLWEWYRTFATVREEFFAKEGQKVLEEYRTLKDAKEKAKFPCCHVFFFLRQLFEKDGHLILEYGEKWSDESFPEISEIHVWNLTERTLLPHQQVIKMFGIRDKKADIVKVLSKIASSIN